jgi:hypothetical protein
MSEQTAKDWNFQIQFPTNSNFVNRITSLTFETAKSSGNPMLKLECEVISPETVDVAGELVNIAGVKTVSYYTTKVIGDDDKSIEASSKCLERITGNNPERPGLLRILFPDNPEFCDQFNAENPDNDMLKKAEGLCILTAMSAKAEERRATPTAAEIEAAKAKRQRPQGAIMKNPRTGKPLVSYRPQVNEIFALAPEGAGANRAY